MPELEHPWSIEERCFSAGYRRVCGVDEAGAGPLAGPVYAAAVILPPGLVLEGLKENTLPEAEEDVSCIRLETPYWLVP